MSRFASIGAALAAFMCFAAPVRPALSQTSNAHPLWTARFDGVGHGKDTARKVATDPAGNVYVAGTVSNGKNLDYETIKYNPASVKLWARRFNAISNQNDYLADMKVDKDGSVYVTGSSYSNITNYDIKTIKYDTNGTMLWSARYDSPFHTEGATAIVLDSKGNVVVAGVRHTSESILSGVCIVLKYDGAAGTLLWQSQSDFAAHDVTTTALTTDAQDNIYVAGSTNDYFYYGIAKFDKEGIVLWQKRSSFFGGYTAIPTAIVADEAGGAYVTGTLADIDAGRIATAHYSADGNILWYQPYTAPPRGQYDQESYNAAAGMVRDSAGNIYVVGSSQLGYNFFDGRNGDTDMTVIKYAPDSTRVWDRQYNGSPTTFPNDSGTGIALDSAGHLIVSGTSTRFKIQQQFYTALSEVFATLTLDTDGTVLNIRRYRVPLYSYNSGIALDLSNDIFVVGTLNTSLDYNPIGDLLTLKYAP